MARIRHNAIQCILKSVKKAKSDIKLSANDKAVFASKGAPNFCISYATCDRLIPPASLLGNPKSGRLAKVHVEYCLQTLASL